MNDARRAAATLIVAAVAAACAAAPPPATVTPVTVEDARASALADTENAPFGGTLARRYKLALHESRFHVHVNDVLGGDYEARFGRWGGFVTTDHGVAVFARVYLPTLSMSDPTLEGTAKEMLEVSRFPIATLRAAILVRSEASGDAVVDGTLDLHGVRRHVTFPGKLSREGSTYRFRADTSLPRSAFDVRVPLPFGPFVRDRFRVVMDVVARPERVTVEDAE